MKKKCLYSLLTTYMATLGALSSCNKPQVPAEKTLQKTKKVYVFKPNVPTTRIDTLDITDENYANVTSKGAGGVFFWGTNTVVVYHFKPMSDNLRVVKYCELNNNMRPLFMRHEMEHARKRDIVHNTDRFSPIGRAEVAAMNEIMAPASEIIEAVDYHARTGAPFAYGKAFVTQADSAITSIFGAGYFPTCVNYDYQPIADIVITYALESFKNSVKRGYYTHTIKKAFERTPSPTPKFGDMNLFFTFDPDMQKWDPIWEFESRAGKCNPYKHASWSVRQKLLQTVDSIVCSNTNADKFEMVFRNSIVR
ncbi:MAG: hypothetical protein K2M34_00105 [Alphaproteobacteria bacterium]|nr:hypothetical protein [Alphaproteobacteria bacterium]